MRPEPRRSLRICVFCGARHGSSPAGAKLATEVGATIAVRGHRLVYGAGGVGLMGEVARAASAHGAEIVGVIPRVIYERERGFDAPAGELVVSADMFERKRIMLARSDGFLVLPGGYGTLDELAEVLSLNHLGIIRKPVVLLNADGVWNAFLTLLAELGERGFIGPQNRARLHVALDSTSAVDLLELAISADSPAGSR